jgi:ribosomal protein L30/L7E
MRIGWIAMKADLRDCRRLLNLTRVFFGVIYKEMFALNGGGLGILIDAPQG